MTFLLQSHAVRIEERWGHLPAVDEQDVPQPDRAEHHLEVYIDDMLVKTKEEANHLEDLEETFKTLRQYSMKLNPSKCVFGVLSGKFLGFMVS